MEKRNNYSQDFDNFFDRFVSFLYHGCYKFNNIENVIDIANEIFLKQYAKSNSKHLLDSGPARLIAEQKL